MPAHLLVSRVKITGDRIVPCGEPVEVDLGEDDSWVNFIAEEFEDHEMRLDSVFLCCCFFRVLP